MEDVFLDFDLDEHYDHIDNRGWMNLFQHWAWSGMLCATWAMTGSTFDPRFQRFCMDAARSAARASLRWPTCRRPSRCPTPIEWRQWSLAGERGAARTLLAEWQSRDGLNFWEAELVDEVHARHPAPGAAAVSDLRHGREPAPVRRQSRCASTSATSSATSWWRRAWLRAFVLHYMRIQNHLRKMGLARDALMSLRRTLGVEIDVGDPLFDPARRRRHGLGRSAAVGRRGSCACAPSSVRSRVCERRAPPDPADGSGTMTR